MSLRLDWCSHAAAKYACENWHYSKSVPYEPIIKIGVWEDEKYIGCVLFSRGACPNLGTPYGLSNIEVCELSRIALNKHKAPVSKIMSIAIKMLRKKSPGLRLIVSFADTNQGHHGGIYQATNWIYAGKTVVSLAYIDKKGKRWHPRNVSLSGYMEQYGVVKKCLKMSDCKKVISEGKHRYLMPLDERMKKSVMFLSLPYPKRS